MLDFETIIQIFFIVFAAMALFAGVWTIADNFDTWDDFFKSFKDKGYSYLSLVFRKGKHLRFITDFPADLRNACLGKNSFYMETEDDKNPKKAIQREAKRLVRVVLTSDDLINEYFRGQYFTYEDYLSLKETISASEEEDEKNVLDYLKGKLKYENTAEAILEIIVDEMTGGDSDLPAGKRQAAFYYALSMENCIIEWMQKEFVDFVTMLSVINPEVKGVNRSTLSHYLNSEEVKQNSGTIRIKIHQAIAPFIAE